MSRKGDRDEATQASGYNVSHGEVMCSVGNIGDNIAVTVYSDRWSLDLWWCALHEVYKC